MAQIAYKITLIDDLLSALNTIVGAQSDIILASTNISGETTEVCAIAFSEEPDTYFTIHVSKNTTVRDTTYPYTQNTQVKDFLYIQMYRYIDGNYVPYAPYTIDYVCTSGASAASQCYIGNTQGTFRLLNTLPISDDAEYYLFFGKDWLGIINWKFGNIVNYIICSCRSEQQGEGGYILSSNSVLQRQSDKILFTSLFGDKLLCYYNKFGIYKPNYPVDYIDVSYCSVHYNSLVEFREKIPPGAMERYVIVEYKFTHNWYGHCTCSLLFDSAFTNKLPNYNNLVNQLDNYGSPLMSNTLNGISLLLPNYFFIDVAPLSTHEYKYVLDTPEMCYCSMYNMLGGNIVQQNYPNYGDKFMCFPLTTDNEKSRKAGYYKGFAFKLPIKYNNIIQDDDTLEPIKI